MSTRVVFIEKKGFLVLRFYEGDRVEGHEIDKIFRDLKILSVPTVVVFDRGKEVRRHIGITEIEKIIEGVKKIDEQSDYPDDLRLW